METEINKVLLKHLEDFFYGIISLQKYNIHSDDSKDQDFVINYKTDILIAELIKAIDKKVNNEPVEKTESSSREKYFYENINIEDSENSVSISSENPLVHNALEKYNQQMNLVEMSKAQNQKLALSNLISVFESLTTNLTEYILLNVYEKISVIKKVSLEPSDIDLCDNLLSVKSLMVQKYLSDLKYKRFEEWFSEMLEICICDKNGKDFIRKDTNLSNLVSLTNEIMQRRNIIVHNNSIINTEYLNKVPQRHNTENYKKGDVLELSSEYLTKATKVILELGSYFISYTFFKKRVFRHEEICNKIENFGLELYRLGEFPAAKNLFFGLSEFYSKNNSEFSKIFISKFNLFLGYKLQEDNYFIEEFDAFLASLPTRDRIPFNDYDSVELAISCLKDDKDVFMQNVLIFLNANKTDEHITHYLDWPMFNIIREEQEFIDFEMSLYYNDSI